MLNQTRFAKRFLLLVTPIVASSALVPLALSIATPPSLAATLASSKAEFDIDIFSHKPLEIKTLTDTNTFTDATSGQATAEADAFAEFITNPLPPSASNSSFSTASGDGRNYIGEAESVAAVIGYNFLVGEGETFAFNFKGFLDLKTSIDTPQTESASAYGDLSLVLFDNTNKNTLGSFTLFGDLTTLGDDDYLDYESESISFNPTIDTSFGGPQEFAKASIEGNFSRTFDSATSLTLVEAKSNQANVAAVPEPSTVLASLLFCLAGIGYKMKSKVFGAKSNLAQ